MKVTGTYQCGQIELDSSTDWPIGCKVVVEPIDPHADNDLEETPEKIEAWIAEFESIPPWNMTPEEARWQADRAAIRRHTLQNMNKSINEVNL